MTTNMDELARQAADALEAAWENGDETLLRAVVLIAGGDEPAGIGLLVQRTKDGVSAAPKSPFSRVGKPGAGAKSGPTPGGARPGPGPRTSAAQAGSTTTTTAPSAASASSSDATNDDNTATGDADTTTTSASNDGGAASARTSSRAGRA